MALHAKTSSESLVHLLEPVSNRGIQAMSPTVRPSRGHKGLPLLDSANIDHSSLRPVPPYGVTWVSLCVCVDAAARRSVGHLQQRRHRRCRANPPGAVVSTVALIDRDQAECSLLLCQDESFLVVANALRKLRRRTEQPGAPSTHSQRSSGSQAGSSSQGRGQAAEGTHKCPPAVCCAEQLRFVYRCLDFWSLCPRWWVLRRW